MRPLAEAARRLLLALAFVECIYGSAIGVALVLTPPATAPAAGWTVNALSAAGLALILRRGRVW
ncbi:hypothetical protein FACS1894186_5070 [Alphaproteobacteria bacterium]|nr:hypothetical protein FACS1894186_5070 [Alphaproteobacteria bacterium]